MTADTATTSHDILARGLLMAELGAATGSQADSAAARLVFQKLSQRLALLITPVGSEALLRRAVHVSRTRFPFLDGVLATRSTNSVVDKLCDTVLTGELSQAYECLVAVLGTLILLLELFIGERLTLRLLRELWPELPMSQPVRSTDRNGTGKLEATH